MNKEINKLKNKLLKLGIVVNNKYLDKYCKLIIKNKNRVKEKFKTQCHHLIPVCYYKRHKQRVDNSIFNLVHLLYIDHIRAHCYLVLAAKPESLFQMDNFAALNKFTDTLHLKLSKKEILQLEKLYCSIAYQKSYEAGKIAASINSPLKINPEIRARQTALMKSPEMREKISKTMHELRTTVGFSKQHKQHIAEARKRRKEERAKKGLKYYEDCSHCDTRSIGVYCILGDGQRFEFHSIKEAGIWWYNTFKPFGDSFSTATYQRKIEASANGKEIKFGNKVHKCYKVITNIKWFFIK